MHSNPAKLLTSLLITGTFVVLSALTPVQASAQWIDGPPGSCNTWPGNTDGNGAISNEWGGTDPRFRVRSVGVDAALANQLLPWTDARYQQTFWHKKRINSSGKEVLEIECNTVIYDLPEPTLVNNFSFAAHDRNDTASLTLSVRSSATGAWETVWSRADLDTKDGCGSGDGDCYKEVTIPLDRNIQAFLFTSYHDDVEKVYLRFQGFTTPEIPSLPPSCTLAGTPTSIIQGQSSTLSWSSTNATTATLNGAVIPLSGSQVVTPTLSTRYTGVFQGAESTRTCETLVTVTPPIPVDPACGDVSTISSSMNFVLNGSSEYELRTITWRQAVESPRITNSFTIRMYPQSAPTSVVERSVLESAVRVSAGNYSYRLDQATMSELHGRLTAAGTDKLIVQIAPNMTDGAACMDDGEVIVTTSPVINTTDTVTVNVRDGACVGDALPVIEGRLGATWPTGSRAPTTATDFTVDIPTGSTLTTSYTFDSDLYTCNASCTTPISANNCQRTRSTGSFETTIYISQQNVSSWWEVLGGLIYGNSVSNAMPLDGASQPVLCKTAAGAVDPRCSPYLSRSIEFVQSLTAGLPLAGALDTIKGWATERPTTTAQYGEGLPLSFGQTLKRKDGYAYNHFLSLIDGGLLTSLNTTTLNSLPAPAFYALPGSLRIDPSTTINVAPGQKYIFFIPGDLVIGNSSDLDQVLTVNNGGFIAFFVKGDVIVQPEVGKDLGLSNTRMPNAENSGVGQNRDETTADVAGIFVADGAIAIEGNGSSGEPDRRFIGEGSFVSASAIVMQRSYSRDQPDMEWSKIVSGFSPSEVFRHRPDMVLATPRELQKEIIQYREIR